MGRKVENTSRSGPKVTASWFCVLKRRRQVPDIQDPSCPGLDPLSASPNILWERLSCPLAHSSLGVGYHLIWGLAHFWKDTESHPPARPCFLGPQPSTAVMGSPGFSGHGSQTARPVPAVQAGPGSPQAWQPLQSQTPEAAGPRSCARPPTAVPADRLGPEGHALRERPLLTTGSGRPQPGRRR